MPGDKSGLSDIAVREYMKIYKEEYGDEVNFNEAKIQATEFLELIRLILSPQKNYKNVG